MQTKCGLLTVDVQLHIDSSWVACPTVVAVNAVFQVFRQTHFDVRLMLAVMHQIAVVSDEDQS